MKAKKSLGQNFLRNDTIIQKIVSLLNASKDDLIIEIGPGRGALTKNIKNLPCKVIAFEIDEDMHNYLDELEDDKLNIIYKDILDVDLKSVVAFINNNKLFIVGNLPYYITTPIIEHLINSGIKPEQMVFMVQKEVGERLSSKPGNKSFGYMTLFANYYYNVIYSFTVSKNNFAPVPKVDSAIITFDIKKDAYDIDATKYFRFLKESFKYKRKTLKNNLKGYNWEIIWDYLKENGYSETVRPEEISQEDFVEIFKKLA